MDWYPGKILKEGLGLRGQLGQVPKRGEPLPAAAMHRLYLAIEDEKKAYDEYQSLAFTLTNYGWTEEGAAVREIASDEFGHHGMLLLIQRRLPLPLPGRG